MNRREFLKRAGQVMAAGIAPVMLARSRAEQRAPEMQMAIDPAGPWACVYMVEPSGEHNLDAMLYLPHDQRGKGCDRAT
ncbi:MAG: hypothetical protein ACX94C_11685 [Phycisphaerales bacterium]